MGETSIVQKADLWDNTSEQIHSTCKSIDSILFEQIHHHHLQYSTTTSFSHLRSLFHSTSTLSRFIDTLALFHLSFYFDFWCSFFEMALYFACRETFSSIYIPKWFYAYFSHFFLTTVYFLVLFRFTMPWHVRISFQGLATSIASPFVLWFFIAVDVMKLDLVLWHPVSRFLESKFFSWQFQLCMMLHVFKPHKQISTRNQNTYRQFVASLSCWPNTVALQVLLL